MKNPSYPSQYHLRQKYDQYAAERSLIMIDLESLIERQIRNLPSRITVHARTKEFPSYFKKYLRLLQENPHKEPQINDLIGIRLVCPFLEDLFAVEQRIKEKFHVLETEQKKASTTKEFGYESIHLLITIPSDLIEERGPCGSQVAEVQIRTILQDAWAEVEHELFYKAGFTPLNRAMTRKLAAVNASLSLADTIFQEIRRLQQQVNRQMGQRQDSFNKQVEEATDPRIFDDDPLSVSLPDPVSAEAALRAGIPVLANSIDDLLLNALYAHNNRQFSEAIACYSRILEMNPENSIRSLIYKHRGMANFAQSLYQEAIQDFGQAVDLDARAYQAMYYRGVVRVVLQQYAEAIMDFTASLSIKQYQPFCLYYRGQAYYHLEDYPASLADCEASLALEPDIEAAKKLKVLLLRKLKM